MSSDYDSKFTEGIKNITDEKGRGRMRTPPPKGFAIEEFPVIQGLDNAFFEAF